MNEVGGIQVQGPSSVRAIASSTGASVADSVTSGKQLPNTSSTDASSEAKGKQGSASQPSGKELESAVASLNEYVQSIERDLHFSVDEELERTVVKVIDSDSGDVIRQIPDDVVLELARNLKQDGQIHLVDAIG